MRESPRGQRISITKHSARMCGVGEYMKLWTKRKPDACLLCGLPEDATHLWQCNVTGAEEVWSTALGRLAEWMSEVGTDLAIEHAILTNLK